MSVSGRVTLLCIGVVVLAFGGQYLAAGALADRAFLQRAHDDVAYLANAGSPFTWSFDQLDEVAPQGGHAMGSPQIDAGVLVVQPERADPYFWLPLRGRWVDMRRFRNLSLRLWVGAPDHLQVFVSCAPMPAFVADAGSALIPLRHGWQTVTLDLGDSDWWRGGPKASHGWPCPGAALNGLRLDPVTTEQGFAIDWVRLQSVWPSISLDVAGSQPIDLSPGRIDAELERLRLAPDSAPLLHNRSRWRSPETLRQAADAVWQRWPSAVLLPAAQPSWPEWAPDGDGHGLRILVPLLLLGLTWLAWTRRSADSDVLRWVLVVAAGGLMFLVAPGVSASVAWLAMNGGLFLALVAGLLRTAPEFDWRRAFSPLGDPGAWVQAGLWTGLALLLLAGLAAAAGLGEVLQPVAVLQRIERYVLWAGLQQLILGPLIAVSLLRWLRSWPLAVVGAAAVFSCLHFPNVPLSAVTFLMGLVWAHLYLRYRRIVPLALSHGLLGSVFLLLAPALFGGSGEVGLRYLPSIGY